MRVRVALMIVIVIVRMLPETHRRRARRADRPMAVTMPVRVRMTALEERQMQIQRDTQIDSARQIEDLRDGDARPSRTCRTGSPRAPRS